MRKASHSRKQQQHQWEMKPATIQLLIAACKLCCHTTHNSRVQLQLGYANSPVYSRYPLLGELLLQLTPSHQIPLKRVHVWCVNVCMSLCCVNAFVCVCATSLYMGVCMCVCISAAYPSGQSISLVIKIPGSMPSCTDLVLPFP